MSGYLGVRNVVLTRGLGALDWQYPSETYTDDAFDDAHRTEPATAQDLLDELMPRAKRPGQTRS
jgi:hypothetical protein